MRLRASPPSDAAPGVALKFRLRWYSLSVTGQPGVRRGSVPGTTFVPTTYLAVDDQLRVRSPRMQLVATRLAGCLRFAFGFKIREGPPVFLQDANGQRPSYGPGEKFCVPWARSKWGYARGRSLLPGYCTTLPIAPRPTTGLGWTS